MTSVTAVLIPGNMCDVRLWESDGAILTHELEARGLDVVHADVTRDATIAAMATRVLTAITGPLLPIGFSMGANVAIELVRQAPERIVGLVLLSFNAGPDRPERALLRSSQQARVMAGGLSELVVTDLKPAYLSGPALPGDAALKRLVLDMALDLGPNVFRSQSEALRTRDDGRAVLVGFPRPVLMMVGEGDTLCPPAQHRVAAAANAAATLATFADAGHLLPLERPRDCAATIAEWIDHQEFHL